MELVRDEMLCELDEELPSSLYQLNKVALAF
jgi:hypothetical protein